MATSSILQNVIMAVSVKRNCDDDFSVARESVVNQAVVRPADMSPSSSLSAGTFVKLKWMRFKVERS